MAVPTGAALVRGKHVGQTIQILRSHAHHQSQRSRPASSRSVTGRRSDFPRRKRSPWTTFQARHFRQRRLIVHDGLTENSLRPVSALTASSITRTTPPPALWLNLNRATVPRSNCRRLRVNAGQRGAGSQTRAPGNQQSPQSAGHQPSRQTHRLHQRRAGTRSGKIWASRFPR